MRSGLIVLVLLGFLLVITTAVTAKTTVCVGDPDDESITKPTLSVGSVTGDPDDEDFTYPDGSKWKRIGKFLRQHGVFIACCLLALWMGPGQGRVPF